MAHPLGRLRPFSKSLPMALLRAREAVMRHFRPALRHFGITEQQWRVLRALSAVEQSEVMLLAEATHLLAPSLSRILQDLEKQKLISRRTDSEDMRRSFIFITPQGLDLIDRAGAYSEIIYKRLTEKYGAERLQDLIALLQDLEHMMSEGPPLGADLIAEGEGEAPTKTKRAPRRQA